MNECSCRCVGPGYYEPRTPREGPKFTLRERPRQSHESTYIYVTAYYHVAANLLLPPTSFVLLHRLPCLPAADSPGPGAYHPPPVGIKPSSPAYTLSPRLRPTSTASVHTEFNGSPGRQSRGQSAGLGRHEFGRPKTARA